MQPLARLVCYFVSFDPSVPYEILRLYATDDARRKTPRPTSLFSLSPTMTVWSIPIAAKITTSKDNFSSYLESPGRRLSRSKQYTRSHGLMPSVRCDKAAQRRGSPGMCWRLQYLLLFQHLPRKGLEISQTRMQSLSVAHMLDLSKKRSKGRPCIPKLCLSRGSRFWTFTLLCGLCQGKT
jgi:hypothetical protein